MGICGSTPADKNKKDKNDVEEDQNSGEEEEEDEDEKQVKLLLLGAGESGKSTIAKQMQIIHLRGFSEEERKSYKETVHDNIVSSINSLIDAARKMGYKLSEENQAIATKIQEKLQIEESVHVEITPDLVSLIKKLWQDDVIQQVFKRSNEFQIQDNAAYYFQEIDRISNPKYVPNEEDVLRCRAKTTGITETFFTIDDIRFKLVDVGGQRSERKKWIHCFEEVTMVIFCVAMNEYDLKLYEDEKTNRMMESLKLFDEICNSKWFSGTPIVLFLNKSDLFKEKIKKIDLKVCFDDYSGGCDFEKATEYLKAKFVSLNRNPTQKQIYPHLTCATDTENIRVIFKHVQEIVLQQVFANSGII